MKNKKLYKQLLVFLSCITFFITSPSQSTNIRRNNNYAYYYTEKTDDINIKQLYDLINSSIYLTQEEKDALYNEDYLIDLFNRFIKYN